MNAPPSDVADPSLPIKPRFLRELVVVPFENELLIDGADQVQILEGEATQRVIPELIALMDGEQSMDALQRALPGTPAAQVRHAVSFLFDRGLVEEGDGPAEEFPNPSTLAFCRRVVGATGVNRSGRQACRKLQNANVIVCDSQRGGHHADILRTLLVKTGIGSVTLVNRDDLDTRAFETGTSRAQPLIVSLSVDGDDREWHEELEQWCAAHSTRWLRAVFDPHASYADIGPLFDGSGACYRCFHAVHDRSRSRASDVSASAAAGDQTMWIGLLAVEVTYLLSRIGPLLVGRGFRRYECPRWDSRDLRCFRVPGCPACQPSRSRRVERGGEADGERLVDTAAVFEDYAALQSRALIDPRSDRDQSRLGAALSRESKRLAVCPQVRLDPAIPRLERRTLDVLCGRDTPARRMTLDDLAAILMMTGGIRDRQGHRLRRWAATGGNLGSVELYVAVRRVDGLTPGLYFYQSQDHSLALLADRRGMLPIEEFMRRATGDPGRDLPDVLVLFTAAFHRLARKYGPFAYRLANLDAGAAVAQAHLVAGGLGISSETVARWADDLIESELHLETFEEQATAVVALRRGPRTVQPREPAASPGQSAAETRPSKRLARDFFELAPSKVVEQLYRESRLSERELAVLPRSSAPGRTMTDEEDSFGVPLPAPLRDGRSVGAVLVERTTVRDYAREPVGMQDLGVMLHCAHRGDRVDWSADHREGDGLRFLVVALRVDGLRPGVYRYDALNHALSSSRGALSGAELIELLVQEEYASAPVLVWILGSLESACDRHGAWGHRQLLLRAGAAGQRLWFAALARGLAGSIFAGLVPGAARRHLGLDGYHDAGLFAFAAGHPDRSVAPTSV